MPKRVYEQAIASLRFYGPELDPLTVTLGLRLPPDLAHRNGEPHLLRNKRTGSVIERAPYRGGLWSMCSTPWVNSPRLETHLKWLLSQIEPKADAVAAFLREGIQVDLFCYSHGSTQLPPSLPRSIRALAAALGIKIEIDHYYSSMSAAEERSAEDESDSVD